MKSSFTPRFNTNYVPSDDEIESIQKDLVSRSEELARLNERIRELSAQRDEIQVYIDSHKVLISHPRRLPPDIVREIFVACLPTGRNAVMSAREAPLLLCRIYSTWRTIALSTPRLWASLHVSVEFVLSNELRMQAVTQWLQLSAACPLSLSINEDSVSPSSGIPVIQSLVAYSDRWRHVEFMRLSTEAVHEIAEIRPPALEALIFVRPRIHSLLNQLNLVEAPRLRALTLYAPNAELLDGCILDLRVAWGQLQHLTIESSNGGGLTLLGLITLLGRCTQLISFHFTPDESDEVANSVSISMPFLQTFIVSRHSMTLNSVSYFIEHVSMPQLRRFHVPTGFSTGRESSFLVPLGTSSPHIESLTIYIASFSAQSLPETLRSFSSLTRLSCSIISGGAIETTPISSLLAWTSFWRSSLPVSKPLFAQNCRRSRSGTAVIWTNLRWTHLFRDELK
ncbi:hypothetical protein B0H13DRAFT_1658417 [Mycena leptocephala]|nr:hypothetical protein B0H13DRAFT_1658417 [Mycena leptocephala]